MTDNDSLLPKHKSILCTYSCEGWPQLLLVYMMHAVYPQTANGS